jgi:photosystem II stability/assembly factor-like uncharacterized protein
MLPRYPILILTVILFAFSQSFGQTSNSDSYVVEIKLKSSQTLESVSEMFPYLNVKSFNDNTVTAEIHQKYFNSIRNGELDFKVLGTPKPNYQKRKLQKSVGAANPTIQNLVNDVSSDTIRTNILALQNFGTRYEYTPNQDSAGVYIYNQFVHWGLDAEFDTYAVGTTTIYDLDFINANTAWAVGTGGMIVKTTNGGQTWLYCNSNTTTSTQIYGVDFVNGSTGWATAQSGIIRKTTDGGTNWVAQTSGLSVALYDISFANDQLGLIVGISGNILRTTNGGTDWTSITSGTTQTLREVIFVDSLKAWAVGTNGTILKTTNTGFNWSIQSLTPTTTRYLRAVSFIDTLQGWAAGDGRSVYKTTDGGASWIKKTVPSEADSILRGITFINSSTGWLIDYVGIILKTTDGGESWFKQYDHLGWYNNLLNVRSYGTGRVTACGSKGILYSSTNTGDNWVVQTSGLPSQYLHTSSNIVATIPGKIHPEKECVIVAHYDSYSNDPYNSAPGANDNGTGTAAVMEAARLCVTNEFENTIKFVAVSGEELGMYGSDHYAFTTRDNGIDIVGAVNGDMIGYPTTSDTARLVTGSYNTINRLIDSAAIYNQRYGIGLTLVPAIDNTGASDYGPFALAGYDALDIAEGTAEEIWGGADPYYHKITDTFDKLNQGMVKKGVQLMLATVTELARPYANGTIEGKIFNDVNRDSSSVGDGILSGWIVKLYKDGILQERKVTEVNGYYSFKNLLSGMYTVEESLKVDWIQSLPRVSGPNITYITYGTNAAPRAYQISIDINSIVTADFANYLTGILTEQYWVSSGWNLVSVALKMVTKLKNEIFPTAISLAFSYRSGYEAKDTLECGIGYWLKFDSTEQITISGSPFEIDTIDLQLGWNLIGTLSDSILTSSVSTEPEGILGSNFYEYDNGYKITDSLKPMKGYWIKSSSPGHLILSLTLRKK